MIHIVSQQPQISTIDVYSWNIGYNAILYKSTQLSNYIKHNQAADIIVFGFQELTTMSSIRIRRHLRRLFTTHKLIVYKSVCNFNFVISTMIFVRKNKQMHVEWGSTKRNCRSYTKGWVNIVLTINRSFQLNIVNTHLPFSDNLKPFCDQLLEISKVVNIHKNSNVSTILLGDINSRSLILEDCYKKNVQFTNNAMKTKVKQLENKPLQHTILLPRNVISNNNYRSSMICGLHNVQSLSFSKFLKSMLQQDFLKILMSKNRTNNNFNKIFRHFTNDKNTIDLLNKVRKFLQIFNESRILFLPTYKRNPTTGQFSLSKKDKGRLPGYADRILFYNPLNRLKSTGYTSIPITGNDHLPIVQRFMLH